MGGPNAGSMVLLLRMAAGFLLWALHLGVIYGASGIDCTAGLPAMVVPTVIVIATLACGGGCVWIASRALRRRRNPGFYVFVEAGVAVGGLIAILWQALPAIMVQGCA